MPFIKDQKQVKLSNILSRDTYICSKIIKKKKVGNDEHEDEMVVVPVGEAGVWMGEGPTGLQRLLDWPFLNCLVGTNLIILSLFSQLYTRVICTLKNI